MLLLHDYFYTKSEDEPRYYANGLKRSRKNAAAIPPKYHLHLCFALHGKSLATHLGEDTTTLDAFDLYRQLLEGLASIHKNDLMHRDIKPGNLLVDEHGRLKIIDLGSAKDVNDRCATSYVCTLYYRAPELLCGATSYSTAVDLWSAACVFVQIVSRKILFLGANDSDVLFQIFLACGVPSEYDMTTFLTSSLEVKHDMEYYFASPEVKSAVNFHSKENDFFLCILSSYCGMEPEDAELAARCLRVVPSERPSAKMLLSCLVDLR